MITESQFHDAFRHMGREKDFSFAARSALYHYLIGLEEDTGQLIELDVIELCYDYTEYDDIEEFSSFYGQDNPFEDISEIEQQVIRIPRSDGFLVQEL